MPEETMTQESPQQGEPGPAPAAPEVNPFLAATQEAPLDEPASQEPGAETDGRWWPSVDSEDALWDHDSLRSRRETHDVETAERGRLEAQREIAPLVEEGSQQFTGFTQTLRTLLGRMQKAAKEAGWDEDTTSGMLAEHSAAFAAMNKAVDEGYQSQHRSLAFTYFLDALAQDVGDYSLKGDFQNRLSFAARGMDTKFIPDLRKRLTGKDVEAATKPLRDRIGNLEAQIEQAKLQSRQGGGANLAPGSAGGTGINSMDDADKAYNENRISHEDYKRYRERFGVSNR